MFPVLIVVEVTNKQWMVIMDKKQLLILFVLGMEKLEDDKMMNPHCFFMLLSTVAIHIILMRSNNNTISKLFNISSTQCPYSINFLTRPTNLIACFITKTIPGNIFMWFMQKWIRFFWFSWNISLSGLFPNLTSLSVDRYLPPQGAGGLFANDLYMHQTTTPWTDNLSQTGQM